MSKLLIEEPPFQVLPTLARLTSLNEAVALQQLHFEMDRSPHLKHGYDGVLRRWVGYTQEQWKEVFKHIWSKKTIQRIFEALVSQQLILLEQFGKHRGDMTNWYSVDYNALERLVAKTHVDNLSSSSSKRENLKTNNNNTPARETEGSASPNGVVVVLPDEDDPSAIPTPREEAYRLLQHYGVTEHLILPLIRAHSDSEIERQVAHLDFERSQGKKMRNPGGRLAKMIREQWALPPGAEAAYRRRFLSADVAGLAEPPAPAVESPVEMGMDAFDLQVAALPEEQRASLRTRAEQLAQDKNPDMSERLLEAQVQLHMRRLLPQPSQST